MKLADDSISVSVVCDMDWCHVERGRFIESFYIESGEEYESYYELHMKMLTTVW